MNRTLFNKNFSQRHRGHRDQNRKIKIYFIVIVYLCLYVSIFLPSNLNAQEVMLIPRTIYVGDPATLILSLPPAEKDNDIILTPQSHGFPADSNIDFHRIIFEKRVIGSRLIIEFTAFAPGTLEFPVFSIDGEIFPGLSVNVDSILDNNNSFTLSRPAPSLAMPGTAFMLYGTMAVIIFFILFTIWFFAKGHSLLITYLNKWKRKSIFIYMKKVERHIIKELEKGTDKRKILDNLSYEFRNFLSVISADTNYLAMTPHEFKILSAASDFDGSFLGNFFYRCDNSRFSGEDIKTEDIKVLLDDLQTYLAALYKKLFEKQETAA